MALPISANYCASVVRRLVTGQHIVDSCDQICDAQESEKARCYELFRLLKFSPNGSRTRQFDCRRLPTLHKIEENWFLGRSATATGCSLMQV